MDFIFTSWFAPFAQRHSFLISDQLIIWCVAGRIPNSVGETCCWLLGSNARKEREKNQLGYIKKGSFFWGGGSRFHSK